MSMNAHLQELRRKHQTLSDQVELAQRSPGIDDLQVAHLKKQKLQLKQEIYRLSEGQPG